MKVLFTTNIPAPYRINFFNELSKYCDLTVAVERINAKDRQSEWTTLENIEFKLIKLKGIKIGNDTAFCPEIIHCIKHNHFDIIVVGGYSTPTGMLLIEYLRKKKIKFILSTDGGIVKEKENSIKYKLKKHFIGSANYWLSTGEYTSKYLIHYGAKREKIFKYPFTSLSEADITKTTFTNSYKEKIREELRMKEKKVIISVGRFIYEKGYDILLKTKANLEKNIGLYIIGGRPKDEYLKIVIEKNLENVHFIEFKKKEELKKYYIASDLFVLPTRGDIWGLVINEAMACALPVVTTNKCVAGLELIENGENGYIVENENEKQLTGAIEKIINDENLRNNMSNNNVEKIKKYTIENMALEHKKIFEKIIRL